MPFGFSGNDKSSTSSSPGFGAGSMAAGRASERSNYGGGSTSSSTSSSKGSTATAAGRGSNAATGSNKSTGSTATAASRGANAATGRSSTGSTATGFGGGGSTATAASRGANAANRSTTSTATAGRLGNLSGSMAAARAADRASVKDYSPNTPGSTTERTPRGMGTAMDRMGTPSPASLAERLGPLGTTGLGVQGLSATTPGLAVGPATPTGVPLSKLTTVATPLAPFKMVKGKQPPSAFTQQVAQESWAAVLGPENVRLTGVSGLRKGTGARSGRHGPDLAQAVDIAVEVRDPVTGNWRSLDFGKVADLALANKVAEYGMRNYGLQGVGVGHGYMTNNYMHMDTVANPKSGAKEWAGPSMSSSVVNPSTRTAFANARADFARTGRAPEAPAQAQPVSSMIASAREMTPQMEALNRASGQPTTQVAGVTARPAATTASVQQASYAPTRATTQTPATQAPAAQAINSVARPASRPAVQTNGPIPNQIAIQQPTKQNPYKRTGTGDVAAGLMDAVVSTTGLPGMVAQGVSLLTTGTTVGGNVWDASHGKYGENQHKPGDTPESRGSTAKSSDYRPAAIKEAAAKDSPTTPAEDFVQKYIEYKDPNWQSPNIKFTSSVDPMVLTPPEYNWTPPTAPFTFRRI